jgi:hypothetical protein
MVSGRALVYCASEAERSTATTAIGHLILDEQDNIISKSDSTISATNLADFYIERQESLILAIISIKRGVGISDLTYIDVRERGGGLNETVARDLSSYLNQYPELQWLSEDSFGDRPIPLQGVYIVRVPFSILEEVGGTISREHLLEAVKRHMALGAYPIIEFYSTKPTIDAASYDDVTRTLSVHWAEVDYAESYNLYISEELNGIYTKLDGTPITSTLLAQHLMQDATLSGNPQTALYIYVAPVSNGNEWPASEIVKLDLTQPSSILLITTGATIELPPVLSVTMLANIEEDV